MNKQNKFIPIAYCPKCKKKEILNITDMHKDKNRISIGTCAICNTVLNLDKDLKIDYITEKRAKKMGWEVIQNE